jgi:hypothetical protein
MNKNDFQSSQISQRDLAPIAFFLFAVVGGFSVAISKYFSWPIWVVVGIPVVFLVLYVVLAFSLPRLELRKDQLGDNAYYLGFLFTLISLTVTLIQYSSNSEDDFIVSNFGVALAATVVGIFIRSLLSQMRKDIVGIEREMHSTLREASVKLRGQISMASESFGSLHREMAQVTQESVVAIATSHKALAEGLNEIVEAQAKALNEQIKQSSEAINLRTDNLCGELETTTQSLIESVKTEQVALANAAKSAKAAISKFEFLQVDTSALEEIEESVRNFSDSISSKLNEVAKVSSQDAEYLSKVSKTISETANAAESSLEARLTLADQQSTVMRDISERMQIIERSISDRGAQIKNLDSQTQAIDQIVARLQRIEKQLQDRVIRQY